MNAFRWLKMILASGLLLLLGNRLDAQEVRSPAMPQASVGALAKALERPAARWILAGLDLAAVGCFVRWWRKFSRDFPSLTSAPTSGLTRYEEMDEADWKARALAAEARAEKATALLRARLMPQMARWMMTEVVQRLLSHRSELMTSQNQAEQEVAELERRLEKIHAPLAERLHAYERRIAELERELAAKGEENRELIQARIASARKKLESERSKEGPLNWN